MEKNSIVIDDLSIEEFKKYLRFEFSEKRNQKFKDIIRDSMENSGKINNNSLYFINNIRQYITFYRGMDTEVHDIVPSIKRLYGNPSYYKIKSECSYIKNLIKSPFINERNDKSITINLLARMQHYNYRSRLVDITFNYAVAIYMSSYTKYLTDGKVIEFTHKSNKKPTIYSNILDRYHYIASPSNSLNDNLKYMNYVSGFEHKPILNKNYESNPVVIIDRQTFKHNTAAYDLRYDAQEGAFIMFLNEADINDNQKLMDLDCKDLKTSSLSYRRILSKNKITFLFLLAINGVTNITIYPDKDSSHEVNKINAKIGFLKSRVDKLNSFDNSFVEYLNFTRFDKILNPSDVVNIKNLAHHFINSPNIIEFLLTDYLTILEERNNIITNNSNIDITLFNSSVQILISESNVQDFTYLQI